MGWLVTRNDNQFTVDGLSDLKAMAVRGDLSGADMVRAPDWDEWRYAAEVPQLAALLPSDDADDFDYKPKSGNGLKIVLAGALFSALVGGSVVAYQQYQNIPTGDEALFGEGGIAYTQMLVTSPVALLRAEPSASSGTGPTVEKDQVLELLAKRGEWYKARTSTGQEGWLSVEEVIPTYRFGGMEVMDKFDPLYNPDKYVEMANASWVQLPEARNERITVFQLMFRNNSAYPMTDLVVRTTIKDAQGHELEVHEFPVEGTLPPGTATALGTIKPQGDEARRVVTSSYLEKLASENPDIASRYEAGVEVELKSDKISNAVPEIVELRAIPPAE